jgi:deazaflavin-dependent oxidoreductase (nitroreductase family)
VPSDALFKTMNGAHRVLVKLSFGKLGWRGYGMPVLELTTIGRKSGQPRTVMLTSPLQEGETLVVVASRGGDDQQPAWLLNLRDHPEVEVVLQGQPVRKMTAREASPAERERLWPRVVADHDNYAGYQTKTTRQIPLVLLEPAT